MTQATTQTTPPRKHWPTWLTFGTLLAVLTLLLTVMGYGWTTGYLHAFGLRPADLHKTPLDFLLDSEEVIVRLLRVCSEFFRDPPWALLLRFWDDTWAAALSVIVVATLLTYAWVRRESLKRLIRRWGRLHDGLQRVRTGAQHVGEAVKRTLSRAHWAVFAGLSAAYLLVPPVLCVFIIFCLSVFTLLVVSLPLQPALMADRHAKAHVINPDGCASLREEKPVKEGAHCVRLVKDKCEIARGRYIGETNDRVWLLRKQPMRVISVPLDGAAKDQVADEAPPAVACTP